MEKTKLFIDFDSTITNSLEAFVRTFNNIHKTKIDWTKVEKYDFLDQIPYLSSEEKHSIFESQKFFDTIDFINPNTYDILMALSYKFDVYIASIGTPLNLSKKAVWLKDRLPFIKNYCLIYNAEQGMDKSILNCPENSIFIDDCHSNLLSVNSKFKIVFGDTYEWSQNLEGLIRCYNWTDIANILLR